jgi:hypothetical protein
LMIFFLLLKNQMLIRQKKFENYLEKKTVS